MDYFGYLCLLSEELGPLKLALVSARFDATTVSEEKMFEYLWNLEEVQRCLKVEATPASKSEEKAKSFRMQGNDYYRKRNLKQALSYYNRSIMFSIFPSISSNSSSSNESRGTASDDSLMISESIVPGEIAADAPTRLEREAQEATRSVETTSKNRTPSTPFQNNVFPNKEGNLRQEKCDQLELPNKDIGHTTTPKRELALAYGNRSAVLFELQQYEYSLLDIERALQYDYPEELKNKLLHRKSKCLSALRSGKHKEKLVTYFPSTENAMEPSATIIGASNALALTYKPEKGRCVVAKRNIRPGEVLLVEDSSVMCLDEAHVATNCSSCLAHCLAPVPCPTCSLVIFCSEPCRSKGLAGSHGKECQALPILLSHVHMLMSYRLLMQTTHAKVKDLVPILREEAKTRSKADLGLNDDSVYDSSDYRTLYHLTTNAEQSCAPYLLSQCVLAVLVTKLLVESRQYFVDDAGVAFTPGNEDLLLSGTTAFHHILTFTCNNHEVVECQMQKTPMDVKTQLIGYGLSPVLSLFNHSCYPSAFYRANEGHVRVAALRSVKAGEEVTLNYFPAFVEMDLIPRRAFLRFKYSFECHCEACDGDWSSMSSSSKFQIKCPECGSRVNLASKSCLRCRLVYGGSDTFNVREIQDKIFQAMAEIPKLSKCSKDNPALDENLERLVSMIELFDKYILPPNQAHVDLQWLLRRYHMYTSRRYVMMDGFR
nr:SET and MYND domain-containing protein 4-like [Penaeus vannamei]